VYAACVLAVGPVIAGRGLWNQGDERGRVRRGWREGEVVHGRRGEVKTGCEGPNVGLGRYLGRGES